MSSNSIEQQTSENTQPVAWRPKAWRHEFKPAMSHGKFYEECKAGRIETRKMGAATLVVTTPRQYVAALPSKAA
jgi:hypothetical protein